MLHTVLDRFPDLLLISILEHAAMDIAHQDPVRESLSNSPDIHVALGIHRLVSIHTGRVDLVEQLVDVSV